MQKKISNKILDDYSENALNLAKELFPINRSINSPGTLKTLKYQMYFHYYPKK